jgi:hypothetical protein
MDYMLKRWPAFARFLEDGRFCMPNNAAARAIRGIALGGKIVAVRRLRSRRTTRRCHVQHQSLVPHAAFMGAPPDPLPAECAADIPPEVADLPPVWGV